MISTLGVATRQVFPWLQAKCFAFIRKRECAAMHMHPVRIRREQGVATIAVRSQGRCMKREIRSTAAVTPLHVQPYTRFSTSPPPHAARRAAPPWFASQALRMRLHLVCGYIASQGLRMRLHLGKHLSLASRSTTSLARLRRLLSRPPPPPIISERVRGLGREHALTCWCTCALLAMPAAHSALAHSLHLVRHTHLRRGCSIGARSMREPHRRCVGRVRTMRILVPAP